jgi:outer membrane protein OmpA-like peptidoglycan-associated protein
MVLPPYRSHYLLTEEVEMKRVLFVLAGFAIVGCAHHAQQSAVAQPPPPAPAPHNVVISPTVKRVVVTQKGLSLTEKVQFDFDKAKILSASDTLLDEVVTVLRDNPNVQLVQVEGFTSSEGKAEHNQKLSQERADSVRQWLIDHGVAADRLLAKGYGPDQPIADNATEDGREKNRRVEFAILKEDAAPAQQAAPAQPAAPAQQ